MVQRFWRGDGLRREGLPWRQHLVRAAELDEPAHVDERHELQGLVE